MHLRTGPKYTAYVDTRARYAHVTSICVRYLGDICFVFYARGRGSRLNRADAAGAAQMVGVGTGCR
jgi:hypothetical protein